MASGEGSQSNTPADEVSPPGELANLEELPPSQVQRLLEAALQYYRRVDDREPVRMTVTASSLLAGGLILTSSSTGKSLPQYCAGVNGTLAPDCLSASTYPPLGTGGCSSPTNTTHSSFRSQCPPPQTKGRAAFP